jgi:hypothetical protein
MFSDQASGSHISIRCRIRWAQDVVSERRRGVQCVADARVMREGLGPVLGGMHGGVGGDVVVFPSLPVRPVVGVAE